MVAVATVLEGETSVLDPGDHQRLAPDLREPALTVPELRDDFVRRDELISRLEQERLRPLVLVTAPAGYGKTTLLTQWSDESARPFSWVSLAKIDGDPRLLAGAIADASARAGRGAVRKRVLVIDDAHTVAPHVLEPAVLDALSWLPKGSQLVLAGRGEPALRLGRMRADRLLFEVRAEELAMSAAEAGSLLRKAGLEIDFATVHALHGRTEGWPAALGVAAITCAQRSGEPDLNLARWGGDDHALSEYFHDELLAQLSPAAAQFLKRCSVLDHLSGPLCDAVLQRKDSAAMLSALMRANVPMQAIDARHEWFRVHGLFREALRADLRRSDPELQAALNRRAGDWHLTAGNLDRAVDHARCAEDLPRTGELLWPNLRRYLAEGQNDRLEGWLTGVSLDQAAGCLPLALVAAHSNLSAGRVAVAEQWARSATQTISQLRRGSPTRERAGVLIIEAWAARAGTETMSADAARAYRLLPADDPWRATCGFLQGTAAMLMGDEGQAERCLTEGAARGAVLAPDAASLCLAQLGVLALDQGQTALASDLAARARALVLGHALETTPTSALVFAVSGVSAIEDGRVDEAQAAVTACQRLLEPFEESVPWYHAEAMILLARVSLSLGDVIGARQLLADASRLARRTRGIVVFERWFDDAWHQFDLHAETALTGTASLTTAELRILRFLPTHYSFHEIAERLHVSSNTVKTHVHAIYRKLDASSRSEAVSHATHAGLVGS